MKYALRISLQKQWLEEKQRQEQKSYCSYIYESSQQMEGYIQSLLAVSKQEVVHENNQKFKAQDFLNLITEQTKALSCTKYIISNAVEFSSEHSSIELKSEISTTQLHITIKDSGKGFSEKC